MPKKRKKTVIQGPSCSTEDLGRIFSASPIPMLVISRDYKVISMNSAAKKFSVYYNAAYGKGPGNYFGCLGSLESPKGCGAGTMCRTCPIRRLLTDSLESGRDLSARDLTVPLQRGNKMYELRFSLKSIIIGNGSAKKSVLTIEDSSIYHETQQLFTKRNEFLKNVIDSLHDGIVIAKNNRYFTAEYMNPAAEKLFGISRKKALTPNVMPWEIFPQLKNTGLEKALKTASAGEIYVERDVRVAPSRGKEQFLSWFFYPLFSTSGKVANIMVVVRDRTQRKIYEDKLLNEKKLLADYIDMANAIIVSIGKDRRVRLVNNKAGEILGFSGSEITGKDWFANFVPQDQRKSVVNEFHQLLTGKKHDASRFENEVLCRDGTRRLISWNNRAIRDSAGKTTATLSYGIDITKERKNLNMLKESEEKYRALFSNIRDAVFLSPLLKDGTIGKFSVVNDVACKRLGYTMKELLSMSIYDIDAEKSRKSIPFRASSLKEKGAIIFEVENVTKDGRVIHAETSSSIVTIDGKKYVLSISRDITDRKKISERINEQNLYNALRADIWELASNESGNENVFIKNVIEKIVLKTSARRGVCFIKTGNSFTAMHEVTAGKHVKSISGVKLPAGLVEYLQKKFKMPASLSSSDVVHAAFNGETAYGNFVKSIYGRFGSKPGFFFPLILNSTTEGLFMFSSDSDSFWTPEKKALIIDACKIISRTIERNRLEKQLTQSLEKYSSLFINMTEAFALHEIILDKRGKPVNYRFLEVNDSFCAMLGKNRNEIIGRLVTEIIPGIEKDKADWIGTYGKVALTGVEKKLEQHSDVLNKWYSIKAYSPKKMFFAVTFDDITEIKNANKAIIENENKFRSIFMDSPEAVSINSYPDFIFLDVNRAFEELTGMKAKDLIGKQSTEVNLWYDLEERKTFMDLFKKKGEVEDFEHRFHGRNSEIRTGLLSMKPLTFGGQKAYLIINKDITYRKKAERLLEKEAQRSRLMLEIYDNAPGMSDKELYNYVIEHSVAATDSKIGFFHIVSENQKEVILTTWNKEALKNCKTPQEGHYPVERAGNWVDCIRTKKPVIYNDYQKSPNQKGLPAGHVAISRFMSVPVMEGNKVKIIFGVGNKEEPYSEFDMLQLLLISSELNKIIIQRKNQRAIAENEKRFRVLYNSISEAAFVNKILPDGAPGPFIEVNATAYTLFGYKPGKMLGMSPRDLMIPGKGGEHLPEIMKNLSTHNTYNFETINRDASGRQFPVEVNIVKFQLNNETMLLSTVKDISERKKFESALIEREKYFRQITEESEDVTAVIDFDGKIRYVTPSIEKIIGFRQDEIQGRHIISIVPKMLVQSVKNGFNYTLHKDIDSGATEFRMKHKDGSLVVLEVKWQNFGHKSAVNGIVVNARSITDKKRSEEQIRKVIWNLERTNEELEQFAYVASHDLKEPLRMISNYIELLEMRYAEKFDSDGKEFLSYARGGAKRMYELIQGLLTFSRIGKREKDSLPVDLNKIVTDIIKDHSLTVPADNFDASFLPSITANTVEMNQLFGNIIGNAVKFRSKTAKPLIRISARPADEMWEFCVADNGIGLEEQYKDKVFVLFERLHSEEEYPGTGIGLTICKKVVQSMGGRIWLESAPGKGTKIFFTLPKNEVKKDE